MTSITLKNRYSLRFAIPGSIASPKTLSKLANYLIDGQIKSAIERRNTLADYSEFMPYDEDDDELACRRFLNLENILPASNSEAVCNELRQTAHLISFERDGHRLHAISITSPSADGIIENYPGLPVQHRDFKQLGLPDDTRLEIHHHFDKTIWAKPLDPVKPQDDNLFDLETVALNHIPVKPILIDHLTVSIITPKPFDFTGDLDDVVIDMLDRLLKLLDETKLPLQTDELIINEGGFGLHVTGPERQNVQVSPELAVTQDGYGIWLSDLAQAVSGQDWNGERVGPHSRGHKLIAGLNQVPDGQIEDLDDAYRRHPETKWHMITDSATQDKLLYIPPVMHRLNVDDIAVYGDNLVDLVDNYVGFYDDYRSKRSLMKFLSEHIRRINVDD